MGEVAIKEVKGETAAFEIKMDHLDFGKPDSLRYNVLHSVLNEKYEYAIEALRKFLDEESEYPDFKEKASRFLNHSIDLVYAIKAKRNFPGINSLTRSKQYELKEKYKHHLRELQGTLMRIEVIRRDLRINDVRSTIYVVRALWFAALSIIVLAFVLDLVHGLASTSDIVAGDLFDKAMSWFFHLVGI